MNCQQCAAANRSQSAVSLCPSCNAGLCLEHRIEHERTIGPGGTRYGCQHRVTVATLTRALPILRAA
jgi:hypothetical protein